MSVTLRPEEMERLTQLRHAARENPMLRAVTDVLHGNGLPAGITQVLSALGLVSAPNLEAKAPAVRPTTRHTLNT